MKCGECNLLIRDYKKCWRNGKRRESDMDCQWTLADQERWYRRNGGYATDEPMRLHIAARRKAEGGETA